MKGFRISLRSAGVPHDQASQGRPRVTRRPDADGTGAQIIAQHLSRHRAHHPCIYFRRHVTPPDVALQPHRISQIKRIIVAVAEEIVMIRSLPLSQSHHHATNAVYVAASPLAPFTGVEALGVSIVCLCQK